MNQPIKVGLALSGGGAIGAYQVGVIRALAESGTEIHCIAGASIGALNGAILSSSASLEQGAARMGEIWHHLGTNEVLKFNKSAYLRLLTQYGLAMGLSPLLSKSGTLLGALINGLGIRSFSALQDDESLLSDQPLIELMNQFLDPDALASGTPLYASLYPTEGGFSDIISCALAEFGVGKTQDSEFQLIQALPQTLQREALLASAALPLLFQSRDINGKHYSDGGMGGWATLQGNTPVTPLVDAGCNMVIVTHLSDGSLWDRHHFPDTTVLEIRPQTSLSRNEGVLGGMKDLLGFTAENIDSWIDQGYRDTLAVMARIKASIQSRQALNTSVSMLENSESHHAQSNALLQSAMARLK